MANKKAKPVHMELPLSDLKELYGLATTIRNATVVYDDDQLHMANQVIFQMREGADKIATYLTNKGVTRL